MNSSKTIFRKSAKGVEAINSRMHGLSGKPRSVLILIDGKRNSEELLKLAQGLGETEQVLLQLEFDGFIEPVPGTASPA